MFCLIAQFKTEAHTNSFEERTVDFVIATHDKQLKKRLKGTGINPAYMVFKDDDCHATVKAGTHQSITCSTIERFRVDVCNQIVELKDLRIRR